MKSRLDYTIRHKVLPILYRVPLLPLLLPTTPPTTTVTKTAARCSIIKYINSSHSLVKLKRLLRSRLSRGAGKLGNGDRHRLRLAHVGQVFRRPPLVRLGPYFPGNEAVNVRRHQHKSSGDAREKKRKNLLADHGVD